MAEPLAIARCRAYVLDEPLDRGPPAVGEVLGKKGEELREPAFDLDGRGAVVPDLGQAELEPGCTGSDPDIERSGSGGRAAPRGPRAREPLPAAAANTDDRSRADR